MLSFFFVTSVAVYIVFKQCVLSLKEHTHTHTLAHVGSEKRSLGGGDWARSQHLLKLGHSQRSRRQAV